MLLPLEHPGTASAAAELLFLTVYVLTVLYTPRHAVALRLLSLAALAGTSWALLGPLTSLLAVPQLRAATLTFCGIQLLNASDILLLLRADAVAVSELCTRAHARAPAPTAGRHGSCSSNGGGGGTTPAKPLAPEPKSGGAGPPGTAALAAKAAGLLWNLRRVGTPWEVANLAPARPESRARFLLRRGAWTLLAYLGLEVLLMQPPPDAALVAPGKETLFEWGRLTAEDVVFRVAGTIGMGVSVSLLNLIMANVANLVAVGVGASRPEECPTLNGRIGEAYTVRKFWRSVWHQGLQRPLANHAHAIVNAVLPRDSLLSKTSRLLLAFYISGLLHYLTDIGLGLRGNESGAVLFFCLQPLGMMIEAAVQTVPGLPASVRRVIGYLWVVAFMAWSVPVWAYPQMRLGLDPAGTVPFHFLPPLIRALTSK